MKKEDFEFLRNEYLEHITNYAEENGGISPHLTIFADDTEDDKSKGSMIHVPIEDEYMENEYGKNIFITKIVPKIAKKVNKRFNVHAIAWCSEAWMRVAERKKEEDNWKDIPIEKEVVIITIETLDGNDCILYEVDRNGQSVTTEGELIDTVKLIKSESKEMKNIGGRFSKLLEIFKKDDNV